MLQIACNQFERSPSAVPHQTYLDDSRTRTRSDDGSRRTNVESVMAISSRPNDIYHEIFIAAINSRWDCSSSQEFRGSS